MLLKEALEICNKSNWKIDILETLGIEIKNDYFSEEFYKNKLSLLPKWNYFVSDLDWTFFRWTLIKEAFSLFAKFYRQKDILDINVSDYKNFLDDLELFRKLENEAYNKKISYLEYLSAGLFIISKYHNKVNFENFLLYLKDTLYRKQKVNPFKFSFNKMKEVLEKWDNFIFISWASNFVFDIYIELLKKYVSENIWANYEKQLFWISTYANLEEKYVYNLWTRDWKRSFLSSLKSQWIIENITGWMWDTSSDFWISDHLEENTDFYFMNPVYSVLKDFDKLAKSWVNFHFITERKDLIFEFKKENLKILN